MNLRARRLLYITCIIIFIVVAPPLVLYTAGYRFDWEYRRLVETGSLVIKSNPEGAKVYLSGKLHSAVTPTIINDIMPGKINLEVKKDGFHDWQKNVSINPRVTTFVENIKLFPKSTPQLVLSGPVIDYWWNNKQDRLAYTNSIGELRLYNTLNKKDVLLSAAGKFTIKTVSWSPQDDRLIFSRNNRDILNHFIINPDQPEKYIDLSTSFKLNFEQIQWDKNSSDTIYGLSHGVLYRIPFLLKTVRLVQAGPITNFSLSGNKIITLSKAVSKRPALVSYFLISDPNNIKPIITRSNAENDIFINTNSDLIAIYNTSQRILTVIDPNKKNTVEEKNNFDISGVDKIIWSKDGKRLIYTDIGAVYERSVVEPVSKLITRYSQNITNILWPNDESYIFYTVNDSFRVLEINDERDSLVLIDSLPQAKNAIFINQPPVLTFINKDSQLMSLSLALEERGTFLFRSQ